MLNSKPELVVIDKLSSVFGKQEAVGKVGIYEDEEHLKNVVLGHLAKRDKVPPPVEEPEAVEGEAEAKEESGEESKPEAGEGAE